MVRARRVTPHESERRARTMLWHHRFSLSDTPERSDDYAARSAAPACRVHAVVPAAASSMRMDVPRSSMRIAPWTRRSRMASAMVGSLS